MGIRDDIVWSNVNPLENDRAVYEAQSTCDIVFPPEYLELVTKYHGGVPSKSRFKSATGREHIIKEFLPVTKLSGGQNMLDMYASVRYRQDPHYVPFAVDIAGNIVCFKTPMNSVICINDEVGVIDLVAFSFKDFFRSLY